MRRSSITRQWTIVSTQVRTVPTHDAATLAVGGDSLALPGRGLCSSFCTVSRSSVLTACSSSWSFPIFPLRAALLPQHHPALSGFSPALNRRTAGGGCVYTADLLCLPGRGCPPAPPPPPKARRRGPPEAVSEGAEDGGGGGWGGRRVGRTGRDAPHSPHPPLIAG